MREMGAVAGAFAPSEPRFMGSPSLVQQRADLPKAEITGLFVVVPNRREDNAFLARAIGQEAALRLRPRHRPMPVAAAGASVIGAAPPARIAVEVMQITKEVPWPEIIDSFSPCLFFQGHAEVAQLIAVCEVEPN